MKMKALIGLGLSVSLGVNGVALARGGYSGGGGDYHEIGSDAAWFIGTKPIHYCIEISEKFGVSADKIQTDFEDAVKTWRTYILEREIHLNMPKEHRLNLNYKYTGACRGNENLRLYFGIEKPEVTRAKAQFQKPYAFAIREAYDVRSGIGKGFMWFAQTGSVFPGAGDVGFPNWTKPYTLHGMMLHELGHILGVGHVDGTIMAESLMSWMQFMDSSEEWSIVRGKAVLTHIDDLKILFFRSSGPLTIDGKISESGDSQIAPETFKTFMGRSPVGSIKAQFVNPGFKLILSDDNGSETFQIQAREEMKHAFSLLNNCFGVYFLNGDHTEQLSYSSSGVSGLATVQAKTGASYFVHYSINAESLGGPIRMTYIDGGRAKDLFTSKVRGTDL